MSLGVLLNHEMRDSDALFHIRGADVSFRSQLKETAWANLIRSRGHVCLRNIPVTGLICRGFEICLATGLM